MTTTTLPIQNTEWGFWGTVAKIENDPAADAAKAWEIASRRIAEVTTASSEGVRDFLDSRHGRHFADDVANELWKGETLKEAIDAAIARWMGWRWPSSSDCRFGGSGWAGREPRYVWDRVPTPQGGTPIRSMGDRAPIIMIPSQCIVLTDKIVIWHE
jgi:hypothetical protein